MKVIPHNPNSCNLPVTRLDAQKQKVARKVHLITSRKAEIVPDHQITSTVLNDIKTGLRF